MADSNDTRIASAIPQPSRRLFLAAGSAGAVFGPLSAAAAREIEPELFRLGRELEAAHKVRTSFDPFSPDYDEAADDANYERHWALRERIDQIRATSIEELKVKAHAAELASERDPDHECEGPGSFIGLAQSIIRDIYALAGVTA